METFLSLALDAGVSVQTLFLKTEGILAEAAHEGGGFGINFDIFETNLINLAILLYVLFYFGRKVIGNLLSERRSTIETAIREAEERQQAAAGSLAEQQQKLAQAQAKAEQIRADAETSAKVARESILAKAAKDVERLQSDASRDLEAERDRAIADLRQRVATLALEQTESQLQSRLDDTAQQRLVDRSIALLGG
jgi:F-type H+-transporting ATPase subunit b